MKERANNMRTTGILLMTSLALGTWGAVHAQAVLACDLQKTSVEEQHVSKHEDSAQGQPAKTTSAPRAAAGLKVFVDPATGAVVPPPAGVTPETLLPGVDTASEGLTEQSLTNGGVKVDLQGRFRKPLVATMGEDGKVTIQHLSPATEEKR